MLSISRRALVLFMLITGFVAADVLHDAALGAEIQHLLIEGALMLLALAGLYGAWQLWQRERETAAERLAAAVETARAWQEQADRWRSEARVHLDGLGAAIDVQFERWSLSPAEREVALLLLKGLSHHEVAEVRDVSERTARKQARSVYAKAGLTGRAELSAFFLEDLL